MMATSRDYAIGAAAAIKVAQADIDQAVPSFFRAEIPASDVAKLAADTARAVIDAVDADRAKRAADEADI
jgi:hypothetical protein